jgi:hypothetical protein
MLYFHKHALVFLATPKAGSSAIEKALARHADIVFQGEPMLKHCTFQRYKWQVEKTILLFATAAPATMALIRQPEDWLGSWFRYRRRPWLKGSARSTREMSFEQFVQAYLSDPQPDCANVGRQARFLTNPADGATVDILFQYEAMPAVTEFLSKRLGREVVLQRHNVSGAGDLALSSALRSQLEQHLAEDYEMHARALASVAAL